APPGNPSGDASRGRACGPGHGWSGARFGDRVARMFTRRNLLALPVASGFARVLHAQSPNPGAMQLAMHQNTSGAAGYRGSLEGWARAGIRYVELTDTLLDGFLASDTLAGARKVLSDLGLTPVSAAAVLPDVWIP